MTELPPPSQAEERGRALGQTRGWGRRPRGYEALRREGEPPILGRCIRSRRRWPVRASRETLMESGCVCGHIGVRHEAVKTF